MHTIGCTPLVAQHDCRNKPERPRALDWPASLVCCCTVVHSCASPVSPIYQYRSISTQHTVLQHQTHQEHAFGNGHQRRSKLPQQRQQLHVRNTSSDHVATTSLCLPAYKQHATSLTTAPTGATGPRFCKPSLSTAACSDNTITACPQRLCPAVQARWCILDHNTTMSC